MPNWQTATLTKSELVAEDIKSLAFSVSPWNRHVPGQYYDIRLVSQSGYHAERNYSIASPPEAEGVVEFGVQLLKDGEVSPYLFELVPGDEIEIRGPFGRHFTWSVEMPGPLILIAGGSGMVPLMSMLRHYARHGGDREIAVLVSGHTKNHIPYSSELQTVGKKFANVRIARTITGGGALDKEEYGGRINNEMFRELFGHLAGKGANIYVSGSTPFVEAASRLFLGINFLPNEIRTERFGGTELV